VTGCTQILALWKLSEAPYERPASAAVLIFSLSFPYTHKYSHSVIPHLPSLSTPYPTKKKHPRPEITIHHATISPPNFPSPFPRRRSNFLNRHNLRMRRPTSPRSLSGKHTSHRRRLLINRLQLSLPENQRRANVPLPSSLLRYTQANNSLDVSNNVPTTLDSP
jgi:hypothetical protein